MNSRHRLETGFAERSGQGPRQRAPADETIGGEKDRTESIETGSRREKELSSQARGDTRALDGSLAAGGNQGMDQVGAG